MCIILTCEPGVRPDFDLIETCFWNNPDGAGLMWVEDGKVHTSKGFTDETRLYDAIQDVPANSRLVIHMRIATSGGIDVGTCHPFPITDDLDRLHTAHTTCDAALAHNGVIAGMPTDETCGISDTVQFVSTIVNGLYTEQGINKSVCRRIKKAAPGNRFAIMTSDGKVRRMGDGWNTVTKGIQASNDSWRYDRWALKWESYKVKSKTTSTTSYYDDWYTKDEYEQALKICCIESCKMWGDCAEYGPACDEVWDVVDALHEEKGGWYDNEWHGYEYGSAYPSTWDDCKDDDWTVWQVKEKQWQDELV